MKITIQEMVEMHVEGVGTHTKKELTESVKNFASMLSMVIEQAKTETEEVGVTVPNLGTFTVKTRSARQGRNPKNPQEVIEIAESKALTFKQASNVKTLLND